MLASQTDHSSNLYDIWPLLYKIAQIYEQDLMELITYYSNNFGRYYSRCHYSLGDKAFRVAGNMVYLQEIFCFLRQEDYALFILTHLRDYE